MLDPFHKGQLWRTLGWLPSAARSWASYKAMSTDPVPLQDWYLCLNDDTPTTPFDPHYFYQSAWAARCLADTHPAVHVDVGSQIDLIAPLSGFVDVEFVDLRPLEVSLPRLKCIKGSILDLPYRSQSVQSLSCLHVIEHIGLGRYGDPLDAEGSRKACKELQRVLAKGGHLYLSTPVGRERVEFNAHRIHSPTTIVRIFDELEVVRFSSVDDNGVYKDDAAAEDCMDFSYGLGLYHFRRD